MKELLDQYAEYNVWANQRIIALINELNEEQQQKQIASSFDSLYKTILHVWRAETIWWRRVQHEQQTVNDDPFNGSMNILSDALYQQDQLWLEWVIGKDKNALKEKLSYANLKGDQFAEPVYLILIHLFNHGTYHRGQLVTLLHQLGIEKIPSTDFIAWARLFAKDN